MGGGRVCYLYQTQWIGYGGVRWLSNLFVIAYIIQSIKTCKWDVFYLPRAVLLSINLRLLQTCQKIIMEMSGVGEFMYTSNNLRGLSVWANADRLQDLTSSEVSDELALPYTCMNRVNHAVCRNRNTTTTRTGGLYKTHTTLNATTDSLRDSLWQLSVRCHCTYSEHFNTRWPVRRQLFTPRINVCWLRV